MQVPCILRSPYQNIRLDDTVSLTFSRFVRVDVARALKPGQVEMSPAKSLFLFNVWPRSKFWIFRPFFKWRSSILPHAWCINWFCHSYYSCHFRFNGWSCSESLCRCRSGTSFPNPFLPVDGYSRSIRFRPRNTLLGYSLPFWMVVRFRYNVLFRITRSLGVWFLFNYPIAGVVFKD